MANGAQSTPGAQLDPFIVNMASLYGLWLGNNGTVMVAPRVAICCSASACTARDPDRSQSCTLGSNLPLQGPLLRSWYQGNFARQLA